MRLADGPPPPPITTFTPDNEQQGSLEYFEKNFGPLINRQAATADGIKIVVIDFWPFDILNLRDKALAGDEQAKNDLQEALLATPLMRLPSIWRGEEGYMEAIDDREYVIHGFEVSNVILRLSQNIPIEIIPVNSYEMDPDSEFWIGKLENIDAVTTSINPKEDRDFTAICSNQISHEENKLVKDIHNNFGNIPIFISAGNTDDPNKPDVNDYTISDNPLVISVAGRTPREVYTLNCMTDLVYDNSEIVSLDKFGTFKQFLFFKNWEWETKIYYNTGSSYAAPAAAGYYAQWLMYGTTPPETAIDINNFDFDAWLELHGTRVAETEFLDTP